MAILPIITAPDDRLKQISLPVESINDNIRQVCRDMLDSMYAADGIGLAAVQIGVHLRILTMDLGNASKRYGDSSQETRIYTMINPEILEVSEEKNTYEEGCLSFPGQYSKVTRPKMVVVKYMDLNGIVHEEEADELLATCVQHEIDHLNGITFVDHISLLKRNMIMERLKKLKNR
jgi:peptide deformylase